MRKIPLNVSAIRYILHPLVQVRLFKHLTLLYKFSPVEITSNSFTG
jgi:hypothetical protein